MTALAAQLGQVGLWLSRRLGDPNPILVKELRATFRTKLFIRFLYLATGAVGLFVLAGGAMVAASSMPPADVGQVVFQIFFSTALFVIVLIAPAYAATALTSEKEQRTYESLVLSGMDAWRVVRGKFIACYASIVLVLVALAPVVGVAFLFGGVSPWHVVTGFMGLLVALAPAVAFGIALSSRLGSTRIAIVIATMVYMPAAMVGVGLLTAAGNGARSEWGTGMPGPFWFTDALATRFFELDTFALVVLLPLYLLGMPVWFLLASAVAGLRPPAEDRSTPLKVWAIVSVLGTLVIAAALVFPIDDGSGAGSAGLAISVANGFAVLFYALVFMNEPPLPPRLAEQRNASGGPLAIVRRAFGPGAAPTLRFTALLVTFSALATALVAAAVRHLAHPAYASNAEHDVAVLLIAASAVPIVLFVASLGAWLRAVLHNGIASRVLAVAACLGATIVPFLAALILDPDSLDNLKTDAPLLVRFSPAWPAVLASYIADKDVPAYRALEVLIPAVVYGLLAVFFWVMLEARIVSVRKMAEATRRRREERARQSIPSVPLLQRPSRPSGHLKPQPADTEQKPEPKPEGAGS